MQEEILEARKDEYSRNRFIEKYKPFLAKYVSTISKKYVAYGQDEELSIALLAFNESIDRYNGEGVFFEYAKLVVKSRLYDYFQSKEYKNQLYKESLDDTNEIYLNIGSQDHYNQEVNQQNLKEEIEILTQTLQYYHIEFNELYTSSPKHFISKRHIDHIISSILDDHELTSHIIDKGQLPIQLIIEQFHTTRKKIEPYRKYIIAVIIICTGQFEMLKEYMPSEVITR